jgi:arylformamidase
LKNNVLIVEGLNLENVKQGEYTLFALPLKIYGVEAAPVRAFLIKED